METISVTNVKPNKRRLRCYFAGSKYIGEHEYVEGCFAHSYKEARALLWRESGKLNGECNGEFFDVKVKWMPEYDSVALAHGITEPCIIRDEKLQRSMGYRLDGDTVCSECGLSDWDGDYPLCKLCERCEECCHALACCTN